MTKKNNQKRNPCNKRPKPYEVIKQNLGLMENVFSTNLNFKKRKEELVEKGKKAKTNFENDHQRLVNYFKEYDSLYLCSFCALFFASGKEGIDEEAVNGHMDFYPCFLETLQCLSLTLEQNISSKLLCENAEDFKETIKKFNYSQSLTSFLVFENAKNKSDIDELYLRMQMMDHTRSVRNWAYLWQMETITYELADLIKLKFIDVYGFDPKVFLDILFSLAPLTEIKARKFIQNSRLIYKAKTFIDVFNTYEGSFSNAKRIGDVEREKIWNDCGQDIQSLKIFFLFKSEMFLADIFMHTSLEIHSHLSKNISESTICSILDEISFRFNELSQTNIDHIFLNNPVHNKPFIKVDDGKYFSVIAQIFSHLGIGLLENFIYANSDLKEKYALKKGKYLEEKVERMFRQSFPKAQIFKGSLWKCQKDQKEYENDLCILIENFAIIIECKSGAVSSSAKRGAPERLSNVLNKLIVEPSEQAIRFEAFLKQHSSTHVFKTEFGAENSIDISKIQYFIPLGITLSNLGSVGSNLKTLINAKTTSRKLEELAPSINLADLEIIFEILPLRAEKIHYLARRREFGAHLNFSGDEIDLLAFYLDNGFNISNAEYDGALHIDMKLKSKEIDPFFDARQNGINIEKPCLKKTKYWNDLLVWLEKCATHWLQASYVLLNTPLIDQIAFETELEGFIQQISTSQFQQPNLCMIKYFGPDRRKYAIAGFPYKNISKEKRNLFISDIASQIVEENVRGFVVLGYDLNTKTYPCSVVVSDSKTDFFDKLDLEEERGG